MRVIRTRESSKVVFDRFWRLRCLSDVLSITTLAFRLVSELVSDRAMIMWFYLAFATTFCIKVSFICMLSLGYLSAYARLGVLIIVLGEMVSDVITFLLLFINITVAFALTFIGFQRGGHFQNTATEDAVSLLPFCVPLFPARGDFNICLSLPDGLVLSPTSCG